MQNLFTDIKKYKHGSSRHNQWIIAHLQRKPGACIASPTAFIVVNNDRIPDLVASLLPTVIITPLSILWSEMYKKRNSTSLIPAIAETEKL